MNELGLNFVDCHDHQVVTGMSECQGMSPEKIKGLLLSRSKWQEMGTRAACSGPTLPAHDLRIPVHKAMML